jgi:hypothetical protein
MPQPDGSLIPVYMTEVDWRQVLTELDHNIYYLTKNNIKDVAGILSMIKDNIERQTNINEC